MSWLQTMWDVGTDVAVISNLIGIRQAITSNKQPTEEMVEAALATMLSSTFNDYIRNKAFVFREAAEELAAFDFPSQKHEAIAYRLLFRYIQKSAVDQRYFSDLYEKEYIGSTLRQVRIRCRQLRMQLPNEEWNDVVNTVESILRMSENQARSFLNSTQNNEEVASILPLFLNDEKQPPLITATLATVNCSKCNALNSSNVWICEQCGKNLFKERDDVTPRVFKPKADNQVTESQSDVSVGQVLATKWINCPKCGYENSSRDFLCANCRNRLR